MNFEIGKSYYKDNRDDSWVEISKIDQDRIYGRQWITRFEPLAGGGYRKKISILNQDEENFWIIKLHDWSLKPIEQKIEVSDHLLC